MFISRKCNSDFLFSVLRASTFYFELSILFLNSCNLTCNALRAAISLNTEYFITTTVRTSNATKLLFFQFVGALCYRLEDCEFDSQ